MGFNLKLVNVLPTQLRLANAIKVHRWSPEHLESLEVLSVFRVFRAVRGFA